LIEEWDRIARRGRRPIGSADDELGRWLRVASSSPFRYRGPRTRKWIRARYVAERQEIAARYAEWEITGPAEIDGADPAWTSFT
jgi:hypothetical protein